MKKFYVNRLVNIWITDTYIVEEINGETIDKAIDYDIDYNETEALYDTIEELGPVEVYDEDWNLLIKI